MSMCQFDTGANTLLCWIYGRHSIRDQKKGVRRSRKRNKLGFIYKSKSCWIWFRQVMWALVDVREAQSWGHKNVPNFAPTSECALFHLLYDPLLSSCLSLLYLRIFIYALVSGTYLNTTIKHFKFFPLFPTKHTKVLQSRSTLFFQGSIMKYEKSF
jgi:hypothetical protein